jgi:hypothetical protein
MIIVKVQRQLSPPRDRTVLFTSGDPVLCVLQPMTADMLAWFEEDELMFYAEAELRDGVPQLRRKVDR